MAAPETVTVMATIEAPIWRVYQNWRRLERFPAFVKSVKEARWLSKERLYWREEFKGEDYEITYEVKINEAESSLTWRSLSGPEASGRAIIEAQPMGHSQITLEIHFTRDDGLQTPEAVRQRHRDFLISFKRFVEGQSSRMRYE